MSAFVGTYRDEMDASYAADFGRDREPMKTRSRRPEYRRKGSAPARVNGIHCRRSKRWTWGSGRGARVMNLRAFAGCLAAAIAAVASTAQAAPLFSPSQFVQISGSNAAQTSGSNVGVGSVSSTYWMSKLETTVAQYGAFLNDQAASDPFSLYNTSMSTIGIARSGSSGSYSYTVTGSLANRPVAFVDYMAAVRFANWATTGSMGSGAYTISGSTASRTGNGFVLPTANEWYKAAFYNPTLNSGSGGYLAYQTLSGSTPVAATPPGGALSANWNNVVTVGGTSVSTDVGAYASNQNYYGLYDTFGNVTEWSETLVSGSARVFSGAFTITNAAQWGANTVATRSLTTEASTIGFRLASNVQPVPEPGTIALAATGVVGIGGAGWLKRRKRKGLAAPAYGPLV